MNARPHPYASPLVGWIDLVLCTAKSYGDGPLTFGQIVKLIETSAEPGECVPKPTPRNVSRVLADLVVARVIVRVHGPRTPRGVGPQADLVRYVLRRQVIAA